MATKVFSCGEMTSESVQNGVRSCRYFESDDKAAIYDGAFVNVGDLDLDGVYGLTTLDYNIHKATAPATGSLTREDICVIDLAGIETWTKGTNTIKFGNKLVDLEIPAGENARFRTLHKRDNFWLGLGNFTAAPTVGKYATVSNGSTKLTPSDTITASQFNVKILTSKALTVGQKVTSTGASAYEQLYLVEVL